LTFVPAFTQILRHIQRRLAALDVGIDDIRARRRNSEGDPPQIAFGQAYGQLLPGLAAVGGFMQPTSGATGSERPGLPAELPHGGIDNVRFLGIEGNVGAARVGIDVEDFRPGLAAVGGFVQPAFLAGGPQRPQRRHINRVGTARVNDNAGNPFGFFQPHARPGFAAIGRLIDAVADRDRVARPAFPGAHPDGFRAALVNGQRADGLGVFVKDRAEGQTAVG
jgi:hypothetical protein